MDGEESRNRIVVGMTGASGAAYGYELVKALHERGREVHLIVSPRGEEILSLELGIPKAKLAKLAYRLYANDEMTSPLSSGSFVFDSMVIAPCSMRTLASIASGSSDALIPRVAEVCLKERRRLILVPRETPISLIHIRNMETLALSGATILPAMPAFYPRPETVQDMVRFVVGKILDQLGIDHSLFTRWAGDPRKPGRPGSCVSRSP